MNCGNPGYIAPSSISSPPLSFFSNFLPHFTTSNELLHLFDSIYGGIFERESK